MTSIQILCGLRKKFSVVQVGVEHAIDLKPDVHPYYERARRLSSSEKEEVAKEIEHLLKQGLIETCSSPWAASIVCVRKKDGSLRLAIDYRGLNKRSYNCCQHPLPLIDDLLDRLGGAKYFSTLDVKSGYHQMPVKESDKDKTSLLSLGANTGGNKAVHLVYQEHRLVFKGLCLLYWVSANFVMQ